jgi:hypothetical protein
MMWKTSIISLWGDFLKFIITLLVGTHDLQTLWSPLVSLNCIYFEKTFYFKQLLEKTFYFKQLHVVHSLLEETQEMKISQLLYYWERHTQRHKAAIFIFIFNFFVAKIHWKVPHENIHGEVSVLENFQKKN